MKVKPPDKLITVKCPFNTIIKKDEYKPILFDVCFRTHKLVIQVYQFIRLWILDKYHNKKEIPLISFDVLKMAFCALCSNDKGGNKPQGENAKLLEEFNTFYDKHYKKLNYKEKVNGSYLSQIINSMCVDMLTNIENNIKLNFIKYVNRFVNSTYRKNNNELVEKAEKGKKTELRKQLNKEIYEVKQDLINNTLLSNEKYHIWINKHRNNIFPIDFVNSYEFDIMNNAQKYGSFTYYQHYLNHIDMDGKCVTIIDHGGNYTSFYADNFVVCTVNSSGNFSNFRYLHATNKEISFVNMNDYTNQNQKVFNFSANSGYIYVIFSDGSFNAYTY